MNRQVPIAWPVRKCPMLFAPPLPPASWANRSMPPPRRPPATGAGTRSKKSCRREENLRPVVDGVRAGRPVHGTQEDFVMKTNNIRIAIASLLLTGTVALATPASAQLLGG